LLVEERIPAIETLPSEPSGVYEKGEEERERAERTPGRFMRDSGGVQRPWWGRVFGS
jgi:hypothetical protein